LPGFSSIAFLAMVVLWRIGLWYRPLIGAKKLARAEPHPDAPNSRRVMIAFVVLVVLLFSKQVYVSSLSSYYTFYLIDKFGVSTRRPALSVIFPCRECGGRVFSVDRWAIVLAENM